MKDELILNRVSQKILTFCNRSREKDILARAE